MNKILLYYLKILVIACFFGNSGYARTIYVSNSGNDSGNGSISSPYKTIKKAATELSPGDTVLIAGGVYIEQNIIPSSSGTEDEMIVFKSKPETGDVIISHPGTTPDDNTPIFNFSNRSFIWIEGLHFQNFEFGKASIFITNGQGNVLISNRFENIGNSQGTSWDANSMIWVYMSSRNVIRNNYFNNIFGDGISINRSDYNLVSENTFIEFKGKLRSWGGSYLFSRAIDIQDITNGQNLITLNYATEVIEHIWLDRDGSNNVMLRNVAHNSSGLIFNESRCAFNIIQENIGYNLNTAFHTAQYDNTGWTFDARWVNNVAFNNRVGYLVHKSHRDEFRNNITFNNTDYNIVFTGEALGNGPHIFENNLWLTENKQNSIQLENTSVSVEQFQAAVREKNGLYVNPEFVNSNPGSEDFRLQPTSPAIDPQNKGLDLGAYAVYGPTEVGWNPSFGISDVHINFESVIISAERGAQTIINLKLSNPSTQQVKVEVLPIAGDARQGDDFTFENQTITFEPGETFKSVSITVGGESDYDEIVAFRLSNVINAQAGPQNIFLLKINHSPVTRAYAGKNQVVYTESGSSNGTVILDGSLSISSHGTLNSYIWSINGNQIATGANSTAYLPIGTHTITLTVNDDQGNESEDYITVSVLNSSGIWLEAECGTIGSLWNIEEAENASEEQFVTIKTGYNSLNNAPTDPNGLITYNFEVSESGTYTLWARVLCRDPDSDSFWLKMDDGAFTSWNSIFNAPSWVWDRYSVTYNLSAGSHTLTVGYREDGSYLDKIFLTKNDHVPSGKGAEADNCSPSPITSLSAKHFEDISVYPIPVSSWLNLKLDPVPSEITLYNSSGYRMLNIHNNSATISIDMTNCSPGIYFLKITRSNQSIVKKIIK